MDTGEHAACWSILTVMVRATSHERRGACPHRLRANASIRPSPSGASYIQISLPDPKPVPLHASRSRTRMKVISSVCTLAPGLVANSQINAGVAANADGVVTG